MNSTLKSQINFYINKNGIRIGSLEININTIYNCAGTLIKILVIVLIMYISIKLGNIIINRFVKRQENLRFSINTKKAKTLGAVLKSILRYAVYFFGIVAILEQMFGTISIAFASFGGVALGFGSQNLIKDLLSGFFILFEEQYSVGDYVEIEGKSGIIESIEIRVTRIRDFNGDLHIIPNGLITKVTNHSKGDMRIMVDVSIDPEENINKTIEIMRKSCEKLKSQNKAIVDGPNVIGVVSIKDSGTTIRVVGKAKSMAQWDCENELRKIIQEDLIKENIKMYYPKVIIINDSGMA